MRGATLRRRGRPADEGLVDISSLPPMLPQEMASILGNESGVQALTGGAPSAASSPPAFLDLSPEQQAQMAQLQDDQTLSGGSAYDPTQDVANPSYSEPAVPTGLTDLLA